MNPRALIAGAALAGLLAWSAVAPTAPVVLPTPVAPVTPDCPDGKCPAPEPIPDRKRPKPWGELIGAAVGGPIHADGTEIMLDLPPEMHQRNTGGSDGAGLCVYASWKHSARWCDDPTAELFDWMRKHPGGSYPDKFDKTMKQFCAEKGLAVPPYLNLQTADLGILRQACAAGLMPAVTTMHHSHMISLVSADDRWFVTLDNNAPGKYSWATPAEFKASWLGGQGKGWTLIPLLPGPPPVPTNKPQPKAEIMTSILAPLALSLAMASRSARRSAARPRRSSSPRRAASP